MYYFNLVNTQKHPIEWPQLDRWTNVNVMPPKVKVKTVSSDEFSSIMFITALNMLVFVTYGVVVSNLLGGVDYFFFNLFLEMKYLISIW